MNAINNTGMMYDKNEVVRNLNKVEGFEPKEYLRKEEAENGFLYILTPNTGYYGFDLYIPRGR